MKIACIGCSWTEGTVVMDPKIQNKINATKGVHQSQQATYPYILKQFL